MKYPMLTEARRRKGVTQQQMALSLGLVSRNAYALKERGLRRFTVEEALFVAEELGMSVERLFSAYEVNNMVTLLTEQGERIGLSACATAQLRSMRDNLDAWRMVGDGEEALKPDIEKLTDALGKACEALFALGGKIEKEESVHADAK